MREREHAQTCTHIFCETAVQITETRLIGLEIEALYLSTEQIQPEQ